MHIYFFFRQIEHMILTCVMAISYYPAAIESQLSQFLKSCIRYAIIDSPPQYVCSEEREGGLSGKL